MATFSALLEEIRTCTECAAHLPLGPKPILRVANSQARVLLISQAPGTKVHRSSIPWNDASGDRLRDWLGTSKEEFYDESKFAIMPMGFCYPGKGTSGDLPPRPECAPLWHKRILQHLPNIRLTVLIGQYAQAYYLGNRRRKTLTDTVRAWKEYCDSGYLPIVHPSPRNGIWLRKNPWFEKEIVEFLRQHVREAICFK